MKAVEAARMADSARASSLQGALADAARYGLIAAALAFPILALRAEPDFSNKLVLEPRWSWMLFAALAAFAIRLAFSLAPARAAKPKPAAAEAPSSGAAPISGYIPKRSSPPRQKAALRKNRRPRRRRLWLR